MVRLEDVSATAAVAEDDVVRRLACEPDPRPRGITSGGRFRPLARWTVDSATGRPVCHWIMAL